MKHIEVEFVLKDRVQLKRYPEVSGIVIAIFISFSGTTYRIMEPDGTMTDVDMEGIEAFNPNKS